MQQIVQQQLPPFAGRFPVQLWPLLQAAPGDVLKVKRDVVNSELVVAFDGASYSYALEVGRGTLFELEALFRAGLARLWGRLARRENPAQWVGRVFGERGGGVGGGLWGGGVVGGAWGVRVNHALQSWSAAS